MRLGKIHKMIAIGISAKRQKTQYVCDECKEAFTVKREYERHLKTHQPKQPPVRNWSCSVCDIKFENLTQCRLHQKEFHPVLVQGDQKSSFVSVNKELEKYRHECDICGRVFPRKHVLEKHKAKHVEQIKPVIKCEECNKIFKKPSELNDHNLIHHSDAPPQFKCDHCGQMFVLKDYLRKHIKLNHVLQANIVCNVNGCQQRFKTQRYLREHLQAIKHNPNAEKPYKCNQCDFAARQSYTLKYHLLTHDDKRPCVCDLCPPDKIFRGRTPSALHDHKVRMHSEDKHFQCKVCAKRFNDRSACARHEEIHEKRVYQCKYDNCSFKTNTKSNLAGHIRSQHTHKHIRIKCPSCAFETSSSYSMKVHLFTHTPEGIPKPVQCPWPECTSRFPNNSTMRIHYNTHTNERPYICKFEGCSYAAANSSTLRQHNLMHLNIRRFVCPHAECGFATVQSHTLKNHLIAKHSPEGILRQKRSENALFKSLSTATDLQFKREHVVDLSCLRQGGTRASIDFVCIHNGVIHFIENDEHQHNHYNISCECARMLNVHSSLALEGNTMPVMFWRLNPHAYKKNKIRQHHKLDQRVKVLLRNLRKYSMRDKATLPPLMVHYIGYTSTNGVLDIVNDVEYEEILKPCVVLHHVE